MPVISPTFGSITKLQHILRKQLFKFGTTGAQPLNFRVFARNVLTIRLVDGIRDVTTSASA